MSFNLFGKKKTPAELLRENKRMLDKSIREIERERQSLQTQEKKLIAEIKKTAKQGQMGAVRVMAKDLIRTRHQITKFYGLKSQLQGISLRIQVSLLLQHCLRICLCIVNAYEKCSSFEACCGLVQTVPFHAVFLFMNIGLQLRGSINGCWWSWCRL
jgi:hypothetical protein